MSAAASTSSAEAPAKPSRSARGRPNDAPDVRISKTLSYILRHGAAKENLSMRPDGFVRVSDLLKRPKLKGVDITTLQRIVDENVKQRFTLRSEAMVDESDAREELWIRANQGHSVATEGLELVKISNASELPVVVHGTYIKSWRAISSEGLRVMTRNHIHCATGLVGEEGVISGMRSNCDVYIYLDVPSMLKDSIDIFRSSNNVILTSGIDGVLPPRYFLRAATRSGEMVNSQP